MAGLRWASVGVGTLLTVLLAVGTSACGSGGEPDVESPRALPRTSSATPASPAPSPAESRTPAAPELTRPVWFPESLPVPADARISAVSETTCHLTWLVSGGDFDAVVATLSRSAAAEGLKVGTTSTSTAPPPETVGLDGEVVVDPKAVVRLASLSFDGDSVDASLAVSSPTRGVVMGEYSVSGPACAD